MKRTRNVIQTSIGDEFIGAKFGPNSCLEVVAWCGERIHSNKKYTVFCSVCCEDTELHGDGLFLITKGKIIAGRVPCGCSSSPNWTEQQYKILVGRMAEQKEYTFMGWAEQYKGRDTKIHLSCELGATDTVTIHNFLRGQTCRLRANESIGNKNRKDDLACIESFMETGAYAEGTNLQDLTGKAKTVG